MKATLPLSCLLLLASLPCPGLRAQETRPVKPGPEGNLSLRLEIGHSIDRGIAWLKEHQDSETGAWSQADYPALTALAISALLGDPSRDPKGPLPPAAEKGLDFLVSKVQPDGGIYGKGLATYNTSLSLMALLHSGKQEYLPLIARGRRLLINQQQDYDKRGEADNLFDGGIGYGGSSAHSDLSNTHLALEALYYAKRALADTPYDESREFALDWDAAIEFVSRCQNSEKTVATLGDWAGLREEDKGGFVYYPGDTKSEEIELPGGRTALRSYGSMSYAGLLSFIYAEMSPQDPRVQAVMDWLKKNYTLEENPGMEAQGLFYYYHTMAKALSLANVRTLETADGKKIDWREQLAIELFDRQQRDGSWLNTGSSRWWEDDPALVTGYALLTLEHIWRGL